jgi:hypothetical protein
MYTLCAYAKSASRAARTFLPQWVLYDSANEQTAYLEQTTNRNGEIKTLLDRVIERVWLNQH